jgi:glutamate dehydrogenase
MVNKAGITFAFRVGAETGASAADIARAYAVARDVFDLRGIWAATQALDNRVPAEVGTDLLLEGRKLLDRATRWLLHNRRRPLEIAATVDFFAPGVAALGRALPDLLAAAEREARGAQARELERAGVPSDLAARVAGLEPLLSALDIVDVAAVTALETEDVAAAYFTLGANLELGWLRDRISELPRGDRWQTLARAALRDDLYALHRRLTVDVLRTAPDAPVPSRLDAWGAENRDSAERSRSALRDIRMGGVFDLTTLSVAIREIRALVRPEADAAAGERAGDGRAAADARRESGASAAARAPGRAST